MSKYISTKVIELGSCAFRQWRASHSHCRFLHGYQLKAKLWFGCSELDEKNWAVDFGGLKDLKALLQNIFDHTTTVAEDDPELETFKELDKKGLLQLRVFKNGVGIERAAELVFDVSDTFIKELTNGRCWVEKVEVFEHEDNSALVEKTDKVVEVKNEYHDHLESAPTTMVDDIVEYKPVPQDNPSAARVGSHVTQGMGNPFAGTSWG